MSVRCVHGGGGGVCVCVRGSGEGCVRGVRGRGVCEELHHIVQLHQRKFSNCNDRGSPQCIGGNYSSCNYPLSLQL